MPRGQKRIRILVVDDSADFIDAICCFLEILPNVAVIAKGRSGRDAVTLAHEWMPDLVLMDVRMPEMTGLEAASQLMRELPDVVVILMTAFEDEGIGQASEESGAFAFVMKEHLTQELPRLLELAASQKGWNQSTKNWGRPAQPAPALATEFETQVQQLGLTKQTCAASAELRNWCERNRNRCYIPEWLLNAWGIHVDPTISGEARPR